MPVTLTQRELLALAPAVRKQVKELTTTHWAPVSTAAYQPHKVLVANANVVPMPDLLDDSAMPVGAHCLPLRVVTGTFDGRVRAECILDQGAQFIAMRADVWERLDIPLHPDRIMVLEAADKSKSTTLRMMPNLRMTIGPLTIMLQVQVVKRAPFEVLLGRPFFSLTACKTDDQPDGSQYITLTDPATQRQIRLATKERGGEQKQM